jgi:hypothetical protein
MEWATLFKIFQSWGPPAISSALAVIVLYLIKQFNENAKADVERSKKLDESLGAKMNGMRASFEGALEKQEKRISGLELETVKRETFYRDLSGWKDDINRLSSQITTQFMEFNKSVIDLWKGIKDR